MRGKLAALILAAALTAAGVLTVRQQRIQAAHEMELAVRQRLATQRELASIRAAIAGKLRPERIHTLAQALGPTRPMFDAPASLDATPLQTNADGNVEVLP